MNKKHIFLAIALTLMSGFIISCGASDWVAKINGEKISLEEFNNLYYAQQKQIYNLSNEEIDKMATDPMYVEENPTLNKADFLENLIRQRIVYNKAVEEGALKKDEVKAMIRLAQETVVMAYYIKDKYKNEIKIDSNEIAQVYAREKDKLKGVPIDQAEQYIKQRLFQQRLQMKMRDLVEGLKEVSDIKRNTDILAKKTISQTPSADSSQTPAAPAVNAPLKVEPSKK